MIPYGKQDINKADIDAVVGVLNSDFLRAKADFKLFFLPNDEYRKILLDFSDRQPFLKLLV